jgi:hypothetical protein
MRSRERGNFLVPRKGETAMRLVKDCVRTAEFHRACEAKDNVALQALISALGEARIGWVDRDGKFVDNTGYFSAEGRNGIPVFAPSDNEAINRWRSWKGDFVWVESKSGT